MSKKDDEDDECVTEKLCEARRQTIQEQIDGIKKTIYITSTAVATVVIVVQFVLNLFK
ncbi:MAG: hypothetical protein QXI36_02100 [Candidatus Bathyarchaeia archaeon]